MYKYNFSALMLLPFSQLASGQIVPEERIQASIRGGVGYLRKSQNPNGTFGNGIVGNGLTPVRGTWPIGLTSLSGLALLESSVPPEDPSLRQAAAFVRQFAMATDRTYEVSLAVLFLDKLGDAKNKALIKKLALRLIAGQTDLGGWGYHVPLLSNRQENEVVDTLSNNRPVPNFEAWIRNKKRKTENADNSNTQFAILALWAGRQHGIQTDSSLSKAEARFRSGQNPGGWGYKLLVRGRNGPVLDKRPYGSMTCAGLLALGIGRGVGLEKAPKGGGVDTTDKGIHWGLKGLAIQMNDPTDYNPVTSTGGPKGALNYYFLWSVERVGVLYDLQTIGGKDWYQWGARLILANQRPDGSWLGRGSMGNPVVDTSFALLFLRKSDLLPDLRVTLKKRLRITDPWLDGKTLDPKSFPGGLPTPYRPGEEGSLKDRLPPTLRPRPSDPPRLGGKGKQ